MRAKIYLCRWYYVTIAKNVV